MSKHIETTLTTFDDFVTANSTSKITRVKAAKDFLNDPTPFQVRSFYNPLKRGLIEAFEAGGAPADIRAAAAAASAPRARHYEECAAGAVRWRGRKALVWADVRPTTWSHGDLTVKVNPELGLEIDGVPYVIKLYFKEPALTKRKCEVPLHLLDLCYPDARVGVLDLRRGKLHVPTRLVAGIDALLQGEAASFVTMWNAL